MIWMILIFVGGMACGAMLTALTLAALVGADAVTRRSPFGG